MFVVKIEIPESLEWHKQILKEKRFSTSYVVAVQMCHGRCFGGRAAVLPNSGLDVRALASFWPVRVWKEPKIQSGSVLQSSQLGHNLSAPEMKMGKGGVDHE